jgi:hypothetical protein
VVLLFRRTLRLRGHASGFDSPAASSDGLFSSLLYLKQFPQTFSAVSLHQTQRMAMLSQAPEDGHVDV